MISVIGHSSLVMGAGLRGIFRRLSFERGFAPLCRLMEAAKQHPQSLTAHRSLLTFPRSGK